MPPGVINMSRMLVLNGPRQGVAICLKLRSRTVASGTSVNDIVGYVFNVSCTMAIMAQVASPVIKVNTVPAAARTYSWTERFSRSDPERR